jgi:hypothetical protein
MQDLGLPNQWEDQDVGGLTILKWILERYDGMVWIRLIWLMIGTSEGLLLTPVMNLWVP